MKASEVLRAARKLIETPDKWTKGEYARDAEGKVCPRKGKEACQWCASGALQYVTDEANEMTAAYNFLALGMGIDEKKDQMFVHEWQDMSHRNHGEVLAAFDKAIALAEAQGK